MITLFSLAVITGILGIIAIQIDTYNQISFDQYRYKYFALRDRMAHLVVDGKLEESSWEYQKIVNTINWHIHTVESVSVNKIMSMLVRYHTSSDVDREVNIIKNKTDIPEVIEIMAEFMDVTSNLLKKNSRMQIWMWERKYKKKMSSNSRNTKLAESKISRIRAQRVTKSRSPVAKRNLAIEKINYHRDELRGSLPHAA